ncbi:MinD/ParA family ATP-binding protein [Pseudonocardia dioxanivorans]|uniref:MinD/ParA family ATP-binding protein n=1 Tax=Pseudonocardia dioxanivorans TaxID=240495 RepID=UPI000674BE52|nr:hypothetical protein [Pseudonocardia dioxanivorans]
MSAAHRTLAHPLDRARPGKPGKNILLTDSGTGMVHSAMEGTLELADTLVVVGATTVDGASRTGKTLDWLSAHGPTSDTSTTRLAVLCQDRSSPEVDAQRVHDHFARRCRAVHAIPADPRLAAGGRIDLEALREPTRHTFLEIAATIADDFAAR